MSKRPSKQMLQRSIAILLVVILIGFMPDIVSLAKIQLVNSDVYRKKAESQQLSDTTINAQRGVIYDRNMEVLAQSATVWQVYINPSKIGSDETFEKLVKALSEILELKEETVRKKAEQKKYEYVSIKTQVEKEAKDKILKFVSENSEMATIIGIDPDTKRYYPYGSFASTVLGFTGTDDIGRAGIELKYNDILTGIPGRIITAKNATADVMPNQYKSTYDAKQGTSVVLTIDRVIQYYLETAVAQAAKDAKANGAYGIVMDVKTGAILAMTSKPDFDSNLPHNLTNTEKVSEIEAIEDETERNKALINAQYAQWRNKALSDTYEPGSVFKVFTAAAALEEGVASESTSVTCTGAIKVADRTIRCHKRSGHGTQNFTEGLMNSCNPFFITIGQSLGAEKFYKYFTAFGFNEKSGIDLPAEAAPVAGVTYYTEKNLGISQLSSCAFGQSFQVSAIQMITAIAAIGNGGKLMTPHLVSATLDENGNTISTVEPKMRRQAVSAKTASRVAFMMEQVVAKGTGKNAYVAGFRLAGKTGTSEKLGKDGAYVASFACFAPADDPQIALLVAIDEPVGQINGGQIAAPVAGEVAEKVLTYLNVEPQYTNDELAKLDSTAPNVLGKTVLDARSELKAKGFTVRVIGNGNTVISQTPAYNQTLPKNGVVVIYTQEGEKSSTVVVPNLIGKSVTEANRIAINSGLNIRLSGNSLDSGEVVSYKQSETEGKQVELGTTITVFFKSNTGVTDFT